MGTPPTMRAGWHFGTAASRRRIGRFHLTVSRFPPNLRTPPHAHETSAISLVLNGHYAQQFGSRELDYRPSAVLFRPAAVEHTDRISAQGAVCFIIEPDEAWLAEIGLGSLNRLGATGTPGARAGWLAQQTYAEYRCADVVSPLVVEGLVLALAAQFARVESPSTQRSAPPWLKRTRAALDEHCTRVTLPELAADAGVHPVYLSALFKKTFGQTISSYVRTRRLDAARQALREPNRTIGEIAITHGFASQSHFTRVFREHTGFTPLAYRKLMSTA